MGWITSRPGYKPQANVNWRPDPVTYLSPSWVDKTVRRESGSPESNVDEEWLVKILTDAVEKGVLLRWGEEEVSNPEELLEARARRREKRGEDNG